MRISIIGAGRVACHLAKVFNSEHQLRQVFSRSLDRAQHLAGQFNLQAIDRYGELDTSVDLIIIAVSDQSISEVISELHEYVPDVLIVHTSGSTHLDVLKNMHSRSGVFYPLQTFSVERDIDWKNTPLFIEASSPNDQQSLLDLASSLSSRVYAYSSAQRLSLHLAAVFACNFSNYCYDMAKQVVDAQSVDFSLLYPLILETANKAVQQDPREMQTGPAMRGDRNILNMHQSMLKADQKYDLAQVYELLSQQILIRHQKA